MRVSNDPHEHAMSLNIHLRKPRRVRPGDPAIWVWAAVALMALVPLQHAVASRLERGVAHAAQAQVAPAAPSDAQGSATP